MARREHDGAEELASGAVWSEFCQSLERLGTIVERNAAGQSSLDVAEGYRYLTRLLRAGLEGAVERLDAAHPVVATLPSMVKIGADNPDNLYQTIAIDGAYDYRIRGQRNTVHYFGLGAYGGGGASGASSGGRAGYLDSGAIDTEPDGTFEVLCSRFPMGRNWLRLEADTRQIIVRQSFLDRRRERRVELEVECLTERPYAQIDPVRFKRALLGAVQFAEATAVTFERWTHEFMERPNELHQRPRQEQLTNWSDPNITFYHGYWSLRPGEALVIRAVPPPCDYWNFQLNNWWMESLDYRFLPVTCNSATAAYEDDGTVQIVIAEEDPGYGNWMDTAGHHHGTMGLRWVGASKDVEPEIHLIAPG